MIGSASIKLTGNPFSTRRVRPGAIAFRFPVGQSVDSLLVRLRDQGGWGQIIGQHGSGKSTLLAALLPRLKEEAAQVWLVELREGDRRLPKRLASLRCERRPVQVVVDGYEQLSRFSRWKLKRICRRGGHGLLVTSHESVGLPHLFHVSTDRQKAIEIAKSLTEGAHRDGCPALVDCDDAVACLEAADGNVREMLFGLYDLHEQRRRQAC